MKELNLPLAGRENHPDDTVITVGNVSIGGSKPVLIAGPCAVESLEQMRATAKAVKSAGAAILRGGAYKPRTSPYTFRGLGEDGLAILSQIKREFDIPIVSEITDARRLELFEDVDMLQIGARNMQNFDLLCAVGHAGKPVLLKRGMGCTLEELLDSAEYIMNEGCERIILCERGIRTFEPTTRNTLDISAVPALKRLSHLPVIVDPSHASGLYWMVESLSLAAVAAGADGVMTEVHINPSSAFSDGGQSLTTERFDALAGKFFALSSFMNTL